MPTNVPVAVSAAPATFLKASRTAALGGHGTLFAVLLSSNLENEVAIIHTLMGNKHDQSFRIGSNDTRQQHGRAC